MPIRDTEEKPLSEISSPKWFEYDSSRTSSMVLQIHSLNFAIAKRKIEERRKLREKKIWEWEAEGGG